MDRKYKIVFLLVLLCLVFMQNSYSQCCLSMKYDANGNRIGIDAKECLDEYDIQIFENYTKSEGVMGEEINEVANNVNIVIYPNPNEGVFCVTFEDENPYMTIQIYNSMGVLVNTSRMVDDEMIDISSCPSGFYLVRIIRGNNVYSRVVVKR